MATKKKEEVTVDPSRALLEARQQELLDLLDVMDRNGFRDRGNIENALSFVNRDLSALS